MGKQIANHEKLKLALEALEKLLIVPVKNVAPVNSLEEFILTRNLSAWRAEDFQTRTSLLTELLSFPLTLAQFLNKQDKPVQTIHLIGARAEATLPDMYWWQLFNTTRNINNSNSVLKFIGLDVYPFLKDKTLQFTDNQTLQRKYVPGPYLESTKPDCAVFFNPGFASYQNTWKSSLQPAMFDQIPVLVTGYNQVDAERDAKFVQTLLPQAKLLPIEENPFSSLKQHAEGTTGRMAQANHYTWGFKV